MTIISIATKNGKAVSAGTEGAKIVDYDVEVFDTEIRARRYDGKGKVFAGSDASSKGSIAAALYELASMNVNNPLVQDSAPVTKEDDPFKVADIFSSETTEARKHCKRCDTTKFIAAFAKSASAKDGHLGHCRACEASYKKARREAGLK